MRPATISVREVVIPIGPGGRPGGPGGLGGTLAIPDTALGLVLFAHGSGSGRMSSRNRKVASDLQDAGLATLLFDLLTEEESGERRNVFDIGLLSDRLLLATAWCRASPELERLPIGYFGASTGAAAAIVAAARDREIGAIVSRGGRPDLAMELLPAVTAPTLLIVGGGDTEVLALNRAALGRLIAPRRLGVVPGAGHLFEEPGALDRVAALARGWFLEHLSPENQRGVRRRMDE